MLMYTGWRDVVAEFVAMRTGTDASDHGPQTVAWMLLAVALAAYQQWLDRPDSDLGDLLTRGSHILSVGLTSELGPLGRTGNLD